VRDDFVIFGLDRFGYHIGIVVVVKDTVPDYVGGCVYILDYEAAAAVFGLDLCLLQGV
jgi:hypothetical protein